MNNLITVGLAALIIGGAIGFIIRKFTSQKSIIDAETKNRELLISAKDEALKIKEEAKKESEKRQSYLEEIEKNLRRREESLDKRSEILDGEKTQITQRLEEATKLKEEAKELRKGQDKELQRVSKLTKDEARDILLSNVEKEYKDDLIRKIKAIEESVKETADNEAKKIIGGAIQRMSGDQATETTISSISLPNDEMKGRIIGKEGRNIQIFEKVTGTDLIVDDTPDTVVVSCFNPVRRATGVLALQKLVADGRINPTSIEETYKKAQEEITQQIKEAGEEAAYELSLPGLHPDLLKVLGQLKFRTSYGQNVLRHSIETAFLGIMIAEEIGADVNIVKKAGLLHDIGKAVDHDVPGAHWKISSDILKKFGLSGNVINAVEAHHGDVDPKSVEAIIVKIADAISGARPGARRESFESYVKRLTDLENITNSFKGVEKSYAIQAGREVRILVRPEEIDDLQALKLAKDIAKKIEQDMQYPGVIRVNVIREIRATEYAK
ncbi:MAG: ribonuclease Y [Patescibacteria group bacterium]|jgi:ribonuclease Y